MYFYSHFSSVRAIDLKLYDFLNNVKTKGVNWFPKFIVGGGLTWKEIEIVSLKQRAKKGGGVIKHKMCILGKQETLLLYNIGKNHHFNTF